MTTTWTMNVVAPAAALTIGKAVDNYLLEKRVGGLAKNSFITYERILGDLVSFMGSAALPPDTPTLKHYFAMIFERDYAPATIQLYHAVTSDFCRWLAETGSVAENPMMGIIRPKARRKLPRVLSEAEASRLLLACGRDFNGVRLHAIIMTFLGTGIRVSELAGLEVSSLDMELGELRVIGKGNKERIVPVSLTLKMEMRSWFITRTAYMDRLGMESESLFVGQRGTCPHRSLIERQLKRLCVRAGVSPISPHVLRHTFATNHAARRGGMSGNLWELQQILGHADISTTQLYVKVSARQVREGFGDPLRLFTC